jgi:hypothetical protein
VATLEHIPKDKRIHILTELKRICKMIILHFPCEGRNGEFIGKRCDFAFQDYHKKQFGIKDEKTDEHILAEHPVIDELDDIFPTSQIFGRKNCNIWYKYMTFSRKPVIGFFAGLLYLLLWKKEDNTPPYYECLLVYTK